MALEINGELIHDAVIRLEAQNLKPRLVEALAELDPVTAEMNIRDLAREHIIDRVLLRQQADKDVSPIPPDAIEAALRRIRAETSGGATCLTPMNEQTLIEEATTHLRLDRLIAKVISRIVRPKPKEVTDHYRKHPEEFEAPELIRAAHIVKNVDEANSEENARAAIEAIERKLRAGADFAEVADTESDCPGAGGDLGYFPRGKMVDEFDAIVFDLPIGQMSPTFRTSFGFHIAKVLDRKAAGLQPLDAVRASIEARLHMAKQDRALREYVGRLRSSAQIREVRPSKAAQT